MALADINVRIGTEISQFQRGLRQAERELQASAAKFNQLGNNLSLALSLPLAGIGIGALKSAGNIEALRLGFKATMTAAGKSTAEATAELLKLQKAAEAPGLDFEQAVKGSVRLQNVGFEAEQSRKIISELANAISLTGGTAEQLDGVTKQFAQMQGKGRILQEDLSILVENMPVLSKVMKETFGTANAEGLRKLDISVEEFILKTTEGLAKLERVPGGLNNAFTNAGVSIKLALANVGESLNKALNVTGNLEKFSTWITDLATGFSNLSEGNQKLIIGFGLAAAAAGPYFKIIGFGISTYNVARSAVLTFGKALELSRNSYTTLTPVVGSFQASLKATAVAWRTLDTVAKATVIGAALAVVVGLGIAFSRLSDSMGAAAKVQKSLNDVTLTAEKNIIAERLEAERLTGILADNAASYDQKKAALDRLQQISPDYFKGLSIEKSSVQEITAAYDGYIANLLTAARAQAAQSKIVELEKERLGILDKIAKGSREQIGRAGIGVALGFEKSFAQQVKDIEAEQKALADLAVKANQQNARLQQQAVATAGSPVTGKVLPTGAATGGEGGGKTTRRIAAPDLLPPTQDIATAVDVVVAHIAANLDKKLPQVAASLDVVKNPLTALGEAFEIVDNKAAVFGASFDATGEKIKLTESAIASLLESGVNPYGNAITTLTGQLALLNSEQYKAVQFTNELASAAQAVIESGLESTLIGVGEALGGLLSGAAGTGSLVALILDPIISMVEQLGKIAIATGIAVAGIKKALESLNPIAAIAAGIGLIAIAKIARSQLKNLQPKAFGDGGIITGPTYGLIGERGPEVIFPLSDLKKFVGEAQAGPVQVFGRLNGNDILLSSERSDVRRARTRGY